MAGEQIVEQAPQTAEVMPADPTNNVQAEQPVSAFFPRLFIICPCAVKDGSCGLMADHIGIEI
jgi:hypothetical protein